MADHIYRFRLECKLGDNPIDKLSGLLAEAQYAMGEVTLGEGAWIVPVIDPYNLGRARVKEIIAQYWPGCTIADLP